MKRLSVVTALKMAEEKVINMKIEMETIDEKADKIRKALSEIDNKDLVYWAIEIHGATFESITEHIKRLSKECQESIPF